MQSHVAREKGVSAYVGDGLQPLARRAPPRRCAALPAGAGEAGAGARYHAVAEEGVLARDIAEVIGRGLKVPVVSIA